jgi:NADPH:quinone reductase-like Zn-dependent oxidoreductase
VGARARFEALHRQFDLLSVMQVLDRVFPFAESADAFRHMKSGAHFGKVVIGI